MKKVFFLFLCAFFCFLFPSCQNDTDQAQDPETEDRSQIQDSTVVINIADHTVDEYPLSKLIQNVEYVELETTAASVLYSITNIKTTDSIIYVYDAEQQLKCFDKRGKYLREGYTRGKGPGEVVHCYDFEVDKDYLYILDGAKATIQKYNHQGDFIGKQQLSFRAHRFKRLGNGNYILELGPFGLDNDSQPKKIAITDSNFNIISQKRPK